MKKRQYIYLKLKLQKEYKIKQDLSTKYEKINRFFIINDPSVDKSKNIEYFMYLNAVIINYP